MSIIIYEVSVNLWYVKFRFEIENEISSRQKMKDLREQNKPKPCFFNLKKIKS